MKNNKVFWGVALIAAAVAMLLDGMGVMDTLWAAAGGLSLFRVGVGLLLLARLIFCLCTRRYKEPIWELAALFLLFEKNIAVLCGLPDENIISSWLVLLCTLLIFIGINLLVPPQWAGRKKPEAAASAGSDVCTNQFAESTTVVDCRSFTYRQVRNEMGACHIRFVNGEAYVGDGVLEIINDLGAVTVTVPSYFRVKMAMSSTLGAVKGPDEGPADGPLLTVTGRNGLGSVTVKRER